MYILYFILLTFSSTLQAESSSESAWHEGVYPYERASVEMLFEKKTENFTTENKLIIEVTSSRPVFQNKSLFFQTVNEHVLNNSQEVFTRWTLQFTEEEKEICELDEEAISMDFDKRQIAYILTPTYASDKFVSIFGELHKYAGMPHGSTRYYAFNYWFDGKKMQELTLNSLFLTNKNFIDFITHFCLSTLKNECVGYCNPDDGAIQIEITLDDIEVFTLSKSGLTITFQPYHVGGWADGPYTITLSFESLTPFLNPQGPLREFL